MMPGRWMCVAALWAATGAAQVHVPATPPTPAASTPRVANAALQHTLEGMAAEPAVARAHWGISVVRLDGAVAAAVDAGQFFQPASNAKLFTTAAAMALLPVDERIHTNVLAFGKWQPGGIFQGDLVLEGAGDANLSGRPVPYIATPAGATESPRHELRFLDEMAEQMKQGGMTQFEGDLQGDDTMFAWDPYPVGWEIDDAPWYYGAPVNALMIADNALTVTVTPGSKKASGAGYDDATVTLDPDMPYYTVQARVVTDGESSQQVTIDRSIGSRTLTVTGAMKPDSKPYAQAVSIEDPAEYAALALKRAMEKQGIAVKGDVGVRHGSRAPAWPQESLRFEAEHGSTYAKAQQPATALLGTIPYPSLTPRCTASVQASEETMCLAAEHTGATLYDDVVVTNKTSQNQHAEVMLRLLDVNVLGGNTTAGGVHIVRRFLTEEAGVDPKDFIFYDGSGLSTHDLVTPRAATALLRYAAGQPWGEKWKASLPVGGVDGSLRRRFTGPLAGKVFAKTGTLGEARALSGYLICASGKTVVFSVMVTGHTPLDSRDEAVMDRMVAAIAAAE